LQHFPARADTRQLPRLYHALETAEATGTFPDMATLAPLTARRQRALTVCVSDLYEENDEINHLLARLRATSGDVLLLHLVAGNELNFSHKGPVTFRDLETGQTIQLDADQQRAGYQQQLRQWLRDTAHTARQQGLDYHQLSTADPLDGALREFLKRRQAIS
jgi:pyridoxine 5'-phosphate synthase PdxJ